LNDAGRAAHLHLSIKRDALYAYHTKKHRKLLEAVKNEIILT